MNDLRPLALNYILLRTTRHCCIIIVFLLLCSCQTMYVPSMPNVPMFEGKNQLTTTLNLRNYQLAYAATDHIGFTVNGFIRPPNPLTHFEDDYENENRGVDMAVWYYKIDPKTVNEFAIGYGQGFTSSSHVYGPPSPYSGFGGSAHFRKMYFQWDVVWSGRKETTKWAFTTKLDLVTLYDFRDSNDYYMQNCTSVSFSPGLTWRKKIGDAYLLCGIHIPLPSAVEEEKLSYQYGEYPPFHSRVMANLALVIPIIKPKLQESK